MLDFNLKTPVYINWQRALISRADTDLSQILGLEPDTDIYRLKRYFKGTDSEQSCPAYSELFFLSALDPSHINMDDTLTFQSFMNELLKGKPYKIADTKITMTDADQVLSSEVKCQLHQKLFCIQQLITVKNKAVCMNITYADPAQCSLRFGTDMDIC